MHHPTDMITHTTAFVTPVLERWLEQEIAQWVHPIKDRSVKKGTKEMFYLTTHSTKDNSDSGGKNPLQSLHGLFFLIKREREREMFYLTTHSTHFYLRLYGVSHMVKDHSDSEKGNPLPPHRLLFPINSKDSFICIILHTSRGALAGTRNSSMGSPHEGSIRRPIAP